MVLVLAAVVLAALLVLAIVLSTRTGGEEATHDRASKLPVGAEAAIWSILEAVPDPRNHLALTRDLTGEVRITGTPLDPAYRAEAAAAGRDPWAEAPAPGTRSRDGVLTLHDFDRAS